MDRFSGLCQHLVLKCKNIFALSWWTYVEEVSGKNLDICKGLGVIWHLMTPNFVQAALALKIEIKSWPFASSLYGLLLGSQR